MRRLFLAALIGVALSSAALARPPMETNQLVDDTGTAFGTPANPFSVLVPTAGSGKTVSTVVAVSANTSTQLVGGNDQRIAVEIQCDGTAPVGLSFTGATLTSVAASPRVMPSGSYPLYTPPVAPLTAITAYTGTAQTCRVTEYLR